MLNTPGMSTYGHLAAYINYKYCSQHGYTFIVERCPRKQDMKKDWMWDENNQYVIVWSKPAWVRRHLPMYDYLLLIDSDALFLDHNQKIEDLIQKHIEKNKDVCIIAGEDCRDKDSCYAKNALNTGAMLFVNKPQTLKIIDHWMNAAEKECADWKYRHTREQMCLQILKEKQYDKHIKIIPYHEINGADGNWIRHYMDMSGEERMKFFNEHFQNFFGQECRNFYTSYSPQTTTPPIVKENYAHPKKTPTPHANTITMFVCSILIIIFACFLIKNFRNSSGRKKR